MARFLAFVLIFALGATSVEAQRGASDSDIRAIVPSDWKLLPPDPNRQGRHFVSPSGDAWLSLYGTPALAGEDQAYIRAFRIKDGESITYERHGRSWIVVSGYKGDRIFYRRAMRACGNSQWHQIAFEYPAAQKRAFDRFVTRTSSALKAYGRVGCGV